MAYTYIYIEREKNEHIFYLCLLYLFELDLIFLSNLKNQKDNK